MVASGNGNNQYSIRKSYTKNLELWEILKQCESVFSKAKQQKMKLKISKISRTFQTQAIQKPKNQTTTMIRNNL